MEAGATPSSATIPPTFSTAAAGPTSSTAEGGDTYIVDSKADRVYELAHQGYDRVLTDGGYALGTGQSVEFLAARDATATDAFKLVGNEINQVLRGNAGDNVLNGKGGTDSLYGAAGNDTYIVDRLADRVFETGDEGRDTVVASTSYALAAGQEIEILKLAIATGTSRLHLVGNEFDNLLRGNEGANTLDGGLGSDIMRGLAGRDVFAFSTTLGPTISIALPILPWARIASGSTTPSSRRWPPVASPPTRSRM